MHTVVRKYQKLIQTAGLVLCICMTFSVSVRALDADVHVTRFYTADKAYAEIFIYVVGSSVKYVPDSLNHFASVNVTYFISQGDGVVAGDKYNLLSSGENEISDFMDLRRHILSPGIYVFTIELRDNLDTTNAVTLSKEFTIEPHRDELMQSDIHLLGMVEPASEETVWTRNGMRMMPLPYDWYREDLRTLFFYLEIYHSDRYPGEDYYIRFRIVPDFDSSRVLLEGFKRLKPRAVSTVTQSVDIAGLSSGTYILHVDVFDQTHNPLSSVQRTFFRSNPEIDTQLAAAGESLFNMSFTHEMDEDSLRYALKAIAAVLAQTQVPVLNYLISKGDALNQRRFLHQYWTEKDKQDPERAYSEFMAFAREVDKEYHAAFGYGFETDRGRIMLRYGVPNDIVAVSDEPSAPPYEIWIYHEFPQTGQSNVRFLFYNPSLAGGDFRLLHSTAIGELQNRRWQLELYRDALSEPEPGDFIDARDVRDNFHRRAVEYFND